MTDVILVIGVPGSGKTWVCQQLSDRFTYVPRDDDSDNHAERLIAAARKPGGPVISEVPFGERELVAELERVGLEVTPIFLVEETEIIAERYEVRESKPLSTAHRARAANMKNKAQEWGAWSGTADEAVEHLQNPGMAGLFKVKE